MKIVIDADACPVTDIALREACRFGYEGIIVCDNAHFIERENVLTVVVDKGADSADLKIANIITRGDIVVTGDYGLAALCLGKGARALNHNGLIYTDKNIENLLYSRFVSKKARLSGARTKGPPKRTAEDDRSFLGALISLLEET